MNPYCFFRSTRTPVWLSIAGENYSGYELGSSNLIKSFVFVG
jgi:hypothetical protein